MLPTLVGVRMHCVQSSQPHASVLDIPKPPQPGMLVWRTKDPALDSALRATFESVAEADQRKLPVHALVTGTLDAPLQLTLRAPGRPTSGAAVHEVTVVSALPLASARGRPMTRADVAAALGGGLGGEYPLGLQDVDCSGLGQGRR